MISSVAATAVPISPTSRYSANTSSSSPCKNQHLDSVCAKMTSMTMPMAANKDDKKLGVDSKTKKQKQQQTKKTSSSPARQKSSSSASASADIPPPVAVISAKVFTFSKRHSLSRSSSLPTKSATRGKRQSISHDPNNKQEVLEDYSSRVPKPDKKMGKRHSLSNTTRDVASPTTITTTTQKKKKASTMGKRHSLSHASTGKPQISSSPKTKMATSMGKRHSMSAAGVVAITKPGSSMSSPERDETSRTMGSDSEHSSAILEKKEVNLMQKQQQQQQLLVVTPRRMSASWLGKLSSTVRGVHTTHAGEQEGHGDKARVVRSPTEHVAPPPASSSPTKKSSKQTPGAAAGKTTLTATTTPKKKKTKDAVAAIAAAVRETPSTLAAPRKKKSTSSTGKTKAASSLPTPPLSPKEDKPKESLSSLPVAAATPMSPSTTSKNKQDKEENADSDDSPTSATTSISKKMKMADSPSVGSRTSKKKKNKKNEASKEIAKEEEETGEAAAAAAAAAKTPLPLSFVLASPQNTTQGQQQKRRGSIDSRISAITECTYMSISKIDPDVIMDIADTPPPPTTPMATKRSDLRVRFGNPDLPVYNRQLRHDDCVVVPEFFGPEENWWVYEQLIKEFEELEKRSSNNKDNDAPSSSSAGWKPCPSHLGKYLTWSSDPYESQMFSDICEKVCDYFCIDPKTLDVALNWYKDCHDMQTPHRAETAFKQEDNKANNDDVGTTSRPLRNITVVVSFGAEREITLEMSNNNTASNEEGNNQNDKDEQQQAAAIASISIPQTNNGMFTIGRDVNIRFQHGLVEETDGLAAAVAKHQILAGKGGDGGRIGILISGQAQDALEEPGSPRLLQRSRRREMA